MSSLVDVATRAFKGPRTPQTMIAAFLAWAITVAPAAFARGSTRGAAPLAVLALVAGLAGPLFLGERRRVGRHLGITTFLALSVGAWLLSLHALSPLRLSPFRAATGSVAWAIFALSWREVWPAPPEPRETDAHSTALPARSSLPVLSLPILTAAVCGALLIVLAGFRTREIERGLVAQAVAVACGVALVSAAATIGTTLGRRQLGSGRRFTAITVRALLVLFVVAIGGALYILLRT